MTLLEDADPGLSPLPESGIDGLERSLSEQARPLLNAFAGAAQVAGQRSMFGRYEVVELLGVGGMGRVYRAYDHELLEEVALKILREELLSQSTTRGLFRREVRLARRVAHRNVARIFDFGSVDGHPYLTMEYVEGRSLGDVIASGYSFDESEVLDIIGAIASGLDAAHEVGIIHRDVKPANVILEKGGRAVLTDFGLARLQSDNETLSPGVVGTPLYMSPEQVRGDRLTESSDCYALGLLAYEMATGRLPFRSAGFAQVTERLQMSMPDPRLHRPDLSEKTAAIIRRCLHHEPQQRWTSLAALAEFVRSGKVPAVNLSHAPTSGLPALAESPIKVAVLPFFSADEEVRPFAEGLADDMIVDLSVEPRLRVASAREASAALDLRDRARAWGEHLGVDVVVEGTVRRVKETIRIHLRLLRVVDGEALWARRDECPEADLRGFQATVAREIASALTTPRGDAEGAATGDPWTLELLLRARAAYQSFDREQLIGGQRAIEEALFRSPDDGVLKATGALIHARKWLLARTPEAADLLRAEELATGAVTRHADLAEGHLALGAVQYLKGESLFAARSLKVAIGLTPRLPDAHEILGLLLLEAGHIEAGHERLAAARQINPALRLALFEEARVAALVENETEIIRLMALARSLSPHAGEYWLNAARVVSYSGSAEAALKLRLDVRLHARTAVDEETKWLVLSLLDVHFVQGESETALAQLRELAERSTGNPRRRAFFLELLAETAATSGALDAAHDAIIERDRLNLGGVLWLTRCPLLKRLEGSQILRDAITSAEAQGRLLAEEISGTAVQ